MLQIPCPWCGPRDEVEFHYGGQAGVSYPPDPGACTDAEWGEFLFYRANPKGRFTERWAHTAGCRRWFDLVRDTVTQDIESTGDIESTEDAGEPTAETAGDTELPRQRTGTPEFEDAHAAEGTP